MCLRSQIKRTSEALSNKMIFTLLMQVSFLAEYLSHHISSAITLFSLKKKNKHPSLSLSHIPCVVVSNSHFQIHYCDSEKDVCFIDKEEKCLCCGTKRHQQCYKKTADVEAKYAKKYVLGLSEICF